MRLGLYQRRQLGIALLVGAVLLGAVSLSANRLTGGPPEFGELEQLGLALAAVGVVASVRLISAGWELTLVAGIIAAAFISRIPTLDHVLLEAHPFRQTQTAYLALDLSNDGFNLNAGPPTLGPPFEVPLEFPLFQMLAVIPLKLQLPADAALRLTGLACFLATALLLYGFMRHVAGVPAATAALIVFAFSPFAFLWSRTSMIEYLATAGGVGFAWMTILWREERRPSLAVLALGAGAVGMLVKPTTGIFWILPALAWRTTAARSAAEWRRSLFSPTLAAIVAIPVLLALLWTRHADAVKEAHEATEILTSQSLQTWNFGTLDQREILSNWGTIWNRFGDWVIGPALVLLPVSAFVAWRSRQRLFWLAMALLVVLPPAVFFNLYVVHDYYLAAITPAAAALVGLGAGSIWRGLRSTRARAIALSFAALLAYWTLDATASYWKIAYNGTWVGRPALVAKPLKRSTSADELALVASAGGWSPEYLYYARRRGLGFGPGPPNESLMRQLREQRDLYPVLLNADPTVNPVTETLFSPWAWIGVVGPRLYSLGQSPAEIPGSAVSATNDPEALVASRREGQVLSDQPVAIRCNGTLPVQLPAGRSGTWLSLEADPDTLVKVDRFSPITARRVIAIAPRKGNRLGINCSGSREITITEAIDAPPPVRCAPPRPLRWPGCSAESRSAASRQVETG
jgi:hypothetical protein